MAPSKPRCFRRTKSTIENVRSTNASFFAHHSGQVGTLAGSASASRKYAKQSGTADPPIANFTRLQNPRCRHPDALDGHLQLLRVRCEFQTRRFVDVATFDEQS